MDHTAKARELFMTGYSCSQAVLSAFCEETGLDQETAARFASSFGAGMGRMREVCGAVSGALMVLGMLEGYADPKDQEAKTEHYRRVQEFAEKFRAENGSIICRELLQGVPVTTGSVPEARTAEYYRKRPCVQFVEDAAAILEEMLAASQKGESV